MEGQSGTSARVTPRFVMAEEEPKTEYVVFRTSEDAKWEIDEQNPGNQRTDTTSEEKR